MGYRYRNEYKPSPCTDPDIHRYTSPEEYDHNFCLSGSPIKVLREDNHFVQLVPFTEALVSSLPKPSLYSDALYEETIDYPDNFNGFSRTDQWKSGGEVRMWLENMYRRDSGSLVYAIFDLKKPPPEGKDPVDWPGAFSGIICYSTSSQDNLATELGFVFIFPKAQRSHVLTHSVSLLLSQAFRLPTHPTNPGYGIRRIMWRTCTNNIASLKAAKRLGFKEEGLNRMTKINSKLKMDSQWCSWPGRQGDGGGGSGSRDVWTYAMTYHDWVHEGVEEKVRALVERKF